MKNPDGSSKNVALIYQNMGQLFDLFTQGVLLSQGVNSQILLRTVYRALSEEFLSILQNSDAVEKIAEEIRSRQEQSLVGKSSSPGQSKDDQEESTSQTGTTSTTTQPQTKAGSAQESVKVVQTDVVLKPIPPTTVEVEGQTTESTKVSESTEVHESTKESESSEVSESTKVVEVVGPVVQTGIETQVVEASLEPVDIDLSRVAMDFAAELQTAILTVRTRLVREASLQKANQLRLHRDQQADMASLTRGLAQQGQELFDSLPSLTEEDEEWRDDRLEDLQGLLDLFDKAT